MGSDDSAMQEAMRKQQEDLDRMQEEEKTQKQISSSQNLEEYQNFSRRWFRVQRG